MMLRKLLIGILAGFSFAVSAQQLAFPEAEGYGKYASGGRGGTVVEVTNLKDLTRTGQPEPGSLRAALKTPGSDPITIVFKVSGIIELKSELDATRSNVTIAGQTAPGDGICIKNESVKLTGENIIIRYIRFRPGDELQGQASALNMENSQNIIIDHCSMSWAIEENMGFYDNKYTTVQYCILSEGLYDSYHSKGPRGYGSQWGGQYASYHHNLLAHNRSRSPRINGSRAHDTIALVDYRNNVIFNWGSSGAIYGGEEEIPGGECMINWVNNYYVKGPATSGSYFAAPSYVTPDNTAQGYAEWYVAGNIMEGNPNGVNDDNWKGINASAVGGMENIRVDTEFEVSPITTETAEEALQSVIDGAGAILPVRDDVDARIIEELQGNSDIIGTGIPDSQTEVGGWPTYQSLDPLPDTDADGIPDEYETENGLDPNNADDGKTITESGYSNLELYLNSITGITGTGGVVLSSGLENQAIKVYPNPAKNILHIENSDQLKKIEMYNFRGMLVKSQVIDQTATSISISDLDSGMYLLRVYLQEGDIIERKMIKK